jgi:hypothetical protein
MTGDNFLVRQFCCTAFYMPAFKVYDVFHYTQEHASYSLLATVMQLCIELFVVSYQVCNYL